MKILLVFAHPDDESYGPGGTIARYAQEGAEIHLLTMTRGESGNLGPCKSLPRDEVAKLRTAELQCAAEQLGVQQLIIGDFPDGKLNESAGDAKAFIRDRLRQIDPDVVITFHDRGITGHPDHIAASNWVTEVVRDRKLPTQLLQFGLSEEQARLIEDRKMYPIPEGQITHRVDVSGYLEQKKRAIRCHASQIEIFERMQKLEGGFDSFHRMEFFWQVFPEEKFSSRQDSLV